MWRLALVLGATLACTALLSGQDYRIPRGATIYIENMEHNLDGYILAELVKQKVPLTVVSKPEEAQFIIAGSATDEERRKWHEGWLTVERDKTAGNVRVHDRATGKLVWAGEAGDRSMWWGPLARGGHRKVASRIVKNLKKAIH